MGEAPGITVLRAQASPHDTVRLRGDVVAVAYPGEVYEGIVQDLIDELGQLPGVGPKGAQRMAFHLLQSDPVDIDRLVHTLTEIKDKVCFCQECGNVAQAEQCRICADPRRDATALCLVEEPKDVVAIERTREFRGRYHILGGAINPLRGVGPEDLRFAELMRRLGDGVVTEVIIATNPNLEGEATAAYAARLLKNIPEMQVTRLASGLPVGGDLEYADEATLGRAFEGRKPVFAGRASGDAGASGAGASGAAADESRTSTITLS